MKYTLLFLCALPFGLFAQQDVEHYNNGVKAHNQGNYTAAIQAYEKCLVVNPKHTLAKQNIGKAYYNQSIDAYNESNYKNSIQFAKRALRYDETADMHALIGNNHLQLKDYTAALSAFTKAIEVSQQPAPYYAARSWVYNDMLNNPKRLADMEKAAELDPNNPEYQFYAGKYKQAVSEEKFKTAVTNYNRAIELRPDYRDAYVERAAYYMTFGQFKAALKDLKKAEEYGADVTHLVEAAKFELEMQEEDNQDD